MSEDSEENVSSETDIEKSETEEDTPEKGEKEKKKGGRNRRIVTSHKSRRFGGQANPNPHLEAMVFKRAADKTPYNDRL